MATILTTEARSGQAGVELTPPPLWSSPSDLAWRAGRAVAGMSDIVKATQGRSYSVNLWTAGNTKCVVRFSGRDLSTVTVDREG